MQLHTGEILLLPLRQPSSEAVQGSRVVVHYSLRCAGTVGAAESVAKQAMMEGSDGGAGVRLRHLRRRRLPLREDDVHLQCTHHRTPN
jgi:hypothetical protein